MEHAVRAVRGVVAAETDGAGAVAVATDAELEAIWDFFERLCYKPHSNEYWNYNKSANQGRTLILPKVWDWFLPSQPLGRVTYRLETDSDEMQLYEYIVKLHDWGIPTFFHEQPSHLTRLFVSLESYIRPEFLNTSRPEAVLAAVRERMSQFVVTAMTLEVQKMFGQGAGDELVAVFDASGCSRTLERWKLSLRIVFVEVIIGFDTALFFRDSLVRRLTDMWQTQHQEPWAAALEAHDFGTGDMVVAEDSPKAFWDKTVDKRALMRDAVHRLVWCDIAAGEFAYPERRPLRPLALIDARVALNGKELHAVPGTNGITNGVPSVEIRRLGFDWLKATDWLRLGSIWVSPMQSPTRKRGSPKPVNMETTNPSGEEIWDQYTTQDGHVYYHNQATGVSKWASEPAPEPAPSNPSPSGQLPTRSQQPSVSQQQWNQSSLLQQERQEEHLPHLWRPHHDEVTGKAYYYQPLTKTSVWVLPSGAQIYRPDQVAAGRRA